MSDFGDEDNDDDNGGAIPTDPDVITSSVHDDLFIENDDDELLEI